ncbi:MAG TPA: hypothetical protein VGF81_07140 [Solirubrobacteraceae bacterium]|jgi:hypothetical protein
MVGPALGAVAVALGSTWIEYASSPGEQPRAAEPSSAIAPQTTVPADLPRAVATA